MPDNQLYIIPQDNTKVSQTPVLIPAKKVPVKSVDMRSFITKQEPQMSSYPGQTFIGPGYSKTPYEQYLSDQRMVKASAQEQALKARQEAAKAGDAFLRFISPSGWAEQISGKDLHPAAEVAIDVLTPGAVIGGVKALKSVPKLANVVKSAVRQGLNQVDDMATRTAASGVVSQGRPSYAWYMSNSNPTLGSVIVNPDGTVALEKTLTLPVREIAESIATAAPIVGSVYYATNRKPSAVDDPASLDADEFASDNPNPQQDPESSLKERWEAFRKKWKDMPKWRKAAWMAAGSGGAYLAQQTLNDYANNPAGSVSNAVQPINYVTPEESANNVIELNPADTLSWDQYGDLYYGN